MYLTKRNAVSSFLLFQTIIVLIGLLACSGQQTAQNKQQAEATRGIGEAYMRQGDYTSALRELLKAEQLDPEDPFTQNDLGLCYMGKKRLPESIAHFEKAVTLKANYTPARNNLGVAYLTAGRLDEAIATFKEITQDVLYATPQFPLANLGLAYFRKGDYKTALNYYKEALEIQPDFAIALYGTGRTYLVMKENKLALRYLEKAVKSAPKVGEYHFYLAEAYRLNGQTAQAKESYLTVIDLEPQDSELATQARQRLGRTKEYKQSTD